MEGTSEELQEIMRYEEGRLNKQEVIALFQRLINSGMAWQMHPHFGAKAIELLKSGDCKFAN